MDSEFRTLNQLILETTTKFSNHPAFSQKIGFRTRTYTYTDIYNYLRRINAYFESKDIKPGDKIIILSLNRPEYSVLILGALLYGVTIIPIDFRTNHETISLFVKKTNPKAIFTTQFFESLFKGLDPEMYELDNLFPELEAFEMGVLPQSDPNQIAAILFTSGTTGEPKGTMITCNNILASINSVRQVFVLPNYFRILSLLPLSHALEMFGGFLTTYTYGCHVHYIERINSITIVQAIRRYRIQGMAVVPQMLRIILQNIERRLKEEKNEEQWEKGQKIAPLLPMQMRRMLFNKLHQNLGGSLELFVCGSAPLEAKLAQIWENTGIRVLEGYGASETTGFISVNSMKHNKIGTVGKLLPGLDYQRTEDGELLVAGRNIVYGYYENEEKSKETFQNGWFHTGDIIQVGRDGYLSIVGREKFKIVLADGKKVYPEDIERKLNNDPAVIDSTVFGLPTPEGEVVHAELILKNPKKIDAIINSVNKKLNSHEQVMDYALWHEKDFPRNKTLKVDREAVKQAVIHRKSSTAKGEEDEHLENDKLTIIFRLLSGKKSLRLNDDDILSTDLKLDSLKRVEMLALIEEEFGVSLDEMKLTPQSTIKDLRELIEHGKPVMIEDGEKLRQWQFTPTMDTVRTKLQETIMFPLFNIPLKVKVAHPENLLYLKTPQLFIFNHVGPHDIVSILRILPTEVRKKLAIAATSQIWHDPIYERAFAEIFANAFPFVKAEIHSAMRGNFDRVGQLLDMGYNIMISPEGNYTHTGELLPFHTGAGFIAVEMGVPVVPFKINGYYELWGDTPERKLNFYWPKHPGNVEVIVGEPITFEKGTSYEEATETLRQSLLNLK